MSYHKARPDENRDPQAPTSSVMLAGRLVRPHAEVDGKPITGGWEDPRLRSEQRSKEEEEEKVKQFRDARKQAKEVGKETFDPKTGEPKQEVNVDFRPDPLGDADAAPASGGREAPPEEVKKTVEAEKKYNEGKVDLAPPKADGTPTKPEPKKAEEKPKVEEKPKAEEKK